MRISARAGHLDAWGSRGRRFKSCHPDRNAKGSAEGGPFRIPASGLFRRAHAAGGSARRAAACGEAVGRIPTKSPGESRFLTWASSCPTVVFRGPPLVPLWSPRRSCRWSPVDERGAPDLLPVTVARLQALPTPS